MKGRRFIAGAVCPACGVLDRLVADEARRYCVGCGYSDTRPSAESHGETAPGVAPDQITDALRLIDD